MKIKCENEQCPCYNDEIEVEDWDGTDTLKLRELTTCYFCKGKCTIVPTKRKAETKGFKGVGFGIVHSMNPQQKKEYLKKRSNEHYKREIKPRKEFMDRQFLGKE